MVIVLDAQEAVKPAGKPVGVPIPVAPVVVCVIFGDKAVLIHNVVVIPEVTVFNGITVIVPIALTLPHPPVNGIV